MQDLEPYDILRAAILRKAVDDYETALKKDKKKRIFELERFFLCEWGQLLSNGHGEYIIERCRKEFTENSKNILTK